MEINMFNKRWYENRVSVDEVDNHFLTKLLGGRQGTSIEQIQKVLHESLMPELLYSRGLARKENLIILLPTSFSFMLWSIFEMEVDRAREKKKKEKQREGEGEGEKKKKVSNWH